MAVDFFLKLDSIDGESKDQKHTSEIQLMSWSWGSSQTSSVSGTGGSGAGKANLADLSIMKYVDKASTPLFKSLLAGKHIATGKLTAVKAGDESPFLAVDLTELFVTSIQTSGSSEVPMESVSFSYNTIKIEYFMQDDKGIVASAGSASYDLKTNEKG